MKAVHTFLAIALAATATVSLAQTSTAPAPADASASSPATKYVAPPWIYKTKQLTRLDVDKAIGNPKKVLFIDVRRPDEVTKNGSFPIYLSVQLKDLPVALDYIPKDRQIVTISNRAHRAGDAGDLLTANGFKVAGAIGSEDYKEAGGTIYKIAPPAPAASAASK